LNKTDKSLYSITKDNTTLHLTEKDLNNLINQLYSKCQLNFNELFNIYELNKTIEEQEDIINDLRQQLSVFRSDTDFYC
jgi:hypothetical protein